MKKKTFLSSYKDAINAYNLSNMTKIHQNSFKSGFIQNLYIWIIYHFNYKHIFITNWIFPKEFETYLWNVSSHFYLSRQRLKFFLFWNSLDLSDKHTVMSWPKSYLATVRRKADAGELERDATVY